VAIGLGASGFWFEPRRLVLREAHVALPGWPAGHPLRIAVLTDLHVGSPHNGLRRLSGIVARTNAMRPDLVAIPGDLVIQGVVGGRFVEPEAIAARLTALRAPLGVFAVLGNHDWWFDGPRVRRALGRVGIAVLEDSALAVGTGVGTSILPVRFRVPPEILLIHVAD
jgi:predicted MPP superfamily phosphohydrolase